MQEIIQQRIAEHINLAQALYQQQGEKIEVAASVLAWALKTGKTPAGRSCRTDRRYTPVKSSHRWGAPPLRRLWGGCQGR